MIQCRICKCSLTQFLDLGKTPLANSFLKKNELKSEELTFELDLCFCKNCNLVQLGTVIDPNLMFKTYPWVSGTSDTIPIHFSELAKETNKKFKLDSSSLVIDIGSNDGTLLECFKKLGLKVLGIEPAKNISEIANSKRIKTINNFFNKKTAEELSKKEKAKIITATNVFAHVDNIDDFVEGVKSLLQEDGIFIIEFPYLVDFLEKTEFDTAYHEHLSYFSLKPIIQLFKNHNMDVFDVKRVPVHGGTIRVFVKKPNFNLPILDNVKKLIELENKLHLDSLETYEKFAKRVERLKGDVIQLLKKLKSEGKVIVGYGAPAKGNTLLNYFGIKTNFLDYIVDKNPLKHNLYTPGTHIPIYSVEKLTKDKPDYVFILAWNFADEIMKQQKIIKTWGGKFIIPIPTPQIV